MGPFKNEEDFDWVYNELLSIGNTVDDLIRFALKEWGTRNLFYHRMKEVAEIIDPIVELYDETEDGQ